MKKNLLFIIPLIVLSACNKEYIADEQTDSTISEFKLYATMIETKTENNGLSTTWSDSDRLGVSYAVAGTTGYSSTKRFNVSDASIGLFVLNSGSITLDEDTSYDWYALYPYASGWKPSGGSQYFPFGGSSCTLTQSGNDSMAHLVGTGTTANKISFPVCGKVLGVSGTEYPNIKLKNIASVIEYNVINASNQSIIVTKIGLESTIPIAGNYYVRSITDDEPVLEVTASTAAYTATTLEVSGGTAIAMDSSACFYGSTIPFTLTSDDSLTITVTVSNEDGSSTGSQSFTYTPTSDVSFKSGYIKTFNLNFTASL